MIGEPYERCQVRVHSIADCTLGENGIYGTGAIPSGTFVYYGEELNCFTLGSSGSNQLLTIGESPATLYIDVDKEGVIPMVVREQGYEWVPVYTRKLT